MKNILMISLLMLVGLDVYPQYNSRNIVSGVCMFDHYGPEMFQFLKTDKKSISADNLIKLLDRKVSYYVTPPYRGFIYVGKEKEYNMDSFSYGYNSMDDKRINTLHYCNCKLMFTDPKFNKRDLELSYSIKRYGYTYKGKPTRFYTMVFSPQPDSLILYSKK